MPQVPECAIALQQFFRGLATSLRPAHPVSLNIHPLPPLIHVPQVSECAIALQQFFRGLATSKSSQAKKDASVAVVCVMMKVRAGRVWGRVCISIRVAVVCVVVKVGVGCGGACVLALR